MYNRLVRFVDKHHVLFEKQFGFRSKHSTDHAILSIVDKIQKAIEERNYSCGIFLDFSEAFDTVNHKILLGKLEHYGIRGIANDWFKSYLTDRQQVVVVNNTVMYAHHLARLIIMRASFPEENSRHFGEL